MNDVTNLIDRLKADVQYQQFDTVKDAERPAWPVLQRIVAAEAALASRGSPAGSATLLGGQRPLFAGVTAVAATATPLAASAGATTVVAAATPLPFGPALRGGEAVAGMPTAAVLPEPRSPLSLPAVSPRPSAPAAPALGSLFSRYSGRAARATAAAGDLSLHTVFAQLERKPR